MFLNRTAEINPSGTELLLITHSRGPARRGAYDTKAGPHQVNLNRPDQPLLNMGRSIWDSRLWWSRVINVLSHMSPVVQAVQAHANHGGLENGSDLDRQIRTHPDRGC